MSRFAGFFLLIFFVLALLLRVGVKSQTLQFAFSGENQAKICVSTADGASLGFDCLVPVKSSKHRRREDFSKLILSKGSDFQPKPYLLVAFFKPVDPDEPQSVYLHQTTFSR